jgi:hypothetical protein
MKNDNKHPKRVQAYKDGFYDACLECMKIVIPLNGDDEPEIPNTLLGELILEMMMSKFTNE